jgi:hypothetical protein
MVLDVTPDDICPLVVKVPRRDEHDVTLADPHAPLHLSPDPAESDHAVGTLDEDLVPSRDLLDPAQEFTLGRKDELLQVGFV